MSDRALEGLKILDFSWVAVGPEVTKTLADFGATVVRIESMKSPCAIRLTAPYKDGIVSVNRSTYFAMMNTNKYSMAIDLKHPAAGAVVTKLVSWCDVVVENFTAGMMEKLGWGYDQLKKINPDIIMLRSGNQGQTGPDCSHPGFGFHLSGIAGWPYYTGEVGGDPMPLPVAYTDIIAPPFAVSALMAALEYRDRTGKGQMIDISQLETSMHFLAPAILDYAVNKREGGRRGNLSDYAVPHNSYHCKGEDRWCVIAVLNEEQWQSFCKVIGNTELACDKRFQTFLKRKENEQELDGIVEKWTVNYTPEEVMTIMQQNGVPAGIVQNGQDQLSDPQLKHRKAYWMMKHSEMGVFTHRGHPIAMTETPPDARIAAPCLGEHTEIVCREILNMEDSEFVKLSNSGLFT